MENRVAIVTGGGSGIGRAIVLRLARNGINVAVADINLDAAGSVVEEIRTTGGEAVAVQVDVSKPAEVTAMVSKTVDEFGRLDIMVANAGVNRVMTMQQVTEEAWHWIMDVNAKGIYFCDKAAAIQMIEQGHGGKIINAASTAGRKGSLHESVYSASKFAVVGMTQSLAQELAPHKITVNAYCPGIVDTPLWEALDQDRAKIPGARRMAEMVSTTPLGRVQYAEDVAALVSFLASADSDFITGQSLIQDGGRLMF